MSIYRECYFPDQGRRLPNSKPPGQDPPDSPHNPIEWSFPPEQQTSAGGARRATSASGPATVVQAGGNVAIDGLKWGFGKVKSDFGSVAVGTLAFAAIVGVLGYIASKALGSSLSMIGGTTSWMALIGTVLLPTYVSAALDVATTGGAFQFMDALRGRWLKALPVSALVAAAMTLAGMVFSLLPVLVAIALGFAIWFAADDTPNPLTAIQSSIEMVRQNVGTVLLLLVISTVLNVIGGALCGVGLLATIPISVFMWTYAYVTMRGQYVQF